MYEAVVKPSILTGEPAPAAHGSRAWNVSLGIDSLPYLAHHRLRGMLVLPGSVSVGMAVEAACVTGLGPCRLEAVTFPTALILPESGQRSVQAVLSNAVDGSASFRVSSRARSKRVWMTPWSFTHR